MKPLELTVLAPADHPALPGHFPGTPLVPGVVVLDLLIDALAAHLGAPVRLVRLDQVKFTASLEPAREAQAIVDFEGAPAAAGRASFRIEQGGRPIASGRFGLAARAEAA